MCGEKFSDLALLPQGVGLPPRVRGKEYELDEMDKSIRITPACAGKSSTLAQKDESGKDHPRVCGEKHPEGAGGSPGGGSPPRVRGKVNMGGEIPELTGITPACAGKSRHRAPGPGRSEDHPRVCGEKSWSMLASHWPPGSPPRVRGKVRLSVARGRTTGITPACAGKRALGSNPEPENRDHPRVCGEKGFPKKM